MIIQENSLNGIFIEIPQDEEGSDVRKKALYVGDLITKSYQESLSPVYLSMLKNFETNMIYICAAKFVKRDLLGQSKIKNLKREYKNLKQMVEDFRIVKLLQYIQVKINDIYYHVFVMDYCNGGTLTNKIQNCREYGQNFLISEILSIADKLVGALYALKKKKIIHRDIKPNNIFFNRGELVLGDLGLSNQISKAITPELGTHGFRAPEMFADNRLYGEEVDVWSFGVVLYYITYLRMPFDQVDVRRLGQQFHSQSAYIQNLFIEWPDELRQRAKDNPAQLSKLKQIIQTCLTTDPKVRKWDVIIQKYFQGHSANLITILKNQEIEFMASEVRVLVLRYKHVSQRFKLLVDPQTFPAAVLSLLPGNCFQYLKFFFYCLLKTQILYDCQHKYSKEFLLDSYQEEFLYIFDVAENCNLAMCKLRPKLVEHHAKQYKQSKPTCRQNLVLTHETRIQKCMRQVFEGHPETNYLAQTVQELIVGFYLQVFGLLKKKKQDFEKKRESSEVLKSNLQILKGMFVLIQLHDFCFNAWREKSELDLMTKHVPQNQTLNRIINAKKLIVQLGRTVRFK